MKHLAKSLVLAATSVSLLSCAQTANAQIPQVVGRRPVTHLVSISESGPDGYVVNPDTVKDIHRKDWVVWVFTFETTLAEVELCKTFEAGGSMQKGNPSGSPTGRCHNPVTKMPAIVKGKIIASANSGTYGYTIAFIPSSGDTIVVIDPSLIVDDEG